MDSLPEKFPCPTCGELKKVGISKKLKPYYFCDYCGVQVFIRGKEGIKNLHRMADSEALSRFEGRGSLSDKFEIIKLESNIHFLNLQIEKLDSKLIISRKEKWIINSLREKLEALEGKYLDKLENL